MLFPRFDASQPREATPLWGAAHRRTGMNRWESLMRRAPVLHAFVLLGTTCQLTTGPRLTMPVVGGPVSTVISQDFSILPATVGGQVGSMVEWTIKARSPHTAM